MQSAKRSYKIKVSPETSIALVPLMGWTSVYDIARVAPGAYNLLVEATSSDRLDGYEVGLGAIVRALDLDTRVYVRHSHLDYYQFCVTI